MIEAKTTIRIAGIGKLAEELGVSRGHIYKVARGERTSERIEAVLAQYGVKVKKRRAK